MNRLLLITNILFIIHFLKHYLVLWCILQFVSLREEKRWNSKKIPQNFMVFDCSARKDNMERKNFSKYAISISKTFIKFRTVFEHIIKIIKFFGRFPLSWWHHLWTAPYVFLISSVSKLPIFLVNQNSSDSKNQN